MDKLKHMKTFMHIVEEGNIVRAAQLLGISKAAVSKQLIFLEDTLNVQLLHRTTRKLKLTNSGRLYYESLKNVFYAVSEAEEIVTGTNNKPTGTLKICSNRHFGEKFIIRHIDEFLAIYPNLKLDIELSDRFPDMEKENVDVLCGIDHEGPNHLVRKKIATERQILCATPKYLAEKGIPKTLGDLKNYRYITHSFRNPDNVLLFKNNQEVVLDFNIRLNDAKAMLKCALNHLGFIKIYYYFVEEHLKQKKLIEILKEYRAPAKPIYIFYQQQKFLPTKIRFFIDFLCQKIKTYKSLSNKKCELETTFKED